LSEIVKSSRTAIVSQFVSKAGVTGSVSTLLTVSAAWGG